MLKKQFTNLLKDLLLEYLNEKPQPNAFDENKGCLTFTLNDIKVILGLDTATIHYLSNDKIIKQKLTDDDFTTLFPVVKDIAVKNIKERLNGLMDTSTERLIKLGDFTEELIKRSDDGVEDVDIEDVELVDFEELKNVLFYYDPQLWILEFIKVNKMKNAQSIFPNQMLIDTQKGYGKNCENVKEQLAIKNFVMSMLYNAVEMNCLGKTGYEEIDNIIIKAATVREDYKKDMAILDIAEEALVNHFDKKVIDDLIQSLRISDKLKNMFEEVMLDYTKYYDGFTVDNKTIAKFMQYIHTIRTIYEHQLAMGMSIDKDYIEYCLKEIH